MVAAAARLELRPVAAKQMSSLERLGLRLAEGAPVEIAPRQASLPQQAMGPR